MALVHKNLTVTWVAPVDDNILGYNVVICEQTKTPLTSTVVSAFSDKAQPIHTFQHVLLSSDIEYIAFVQTIYAGKDSSWVSSTNIIVSDDG